MARFRGAFRQGAEARGGRAVIRTIGDLQTSPHMPKMEASEILSRVKNDG